MVRVEFKSNVMAGCPAPWSFLFALRGRKWQKAVTYEQYQGSEKSSIGRTALAHMRVDAGESNPGGET